ncbi:hypothetical protein ACP4OV_006068 [Aristida adscensionis]
MATSSSSSDELAPSKIMREYVAEQSALDSFARRLTMKIKAKISGRASKRQYGPRKTICRDHVGAHQHLVEDYFAEEPLYPENCSGRVGLSPLQKCTAAMRMLAYGTPADALDEYLKIGKSTALECLDKFARGVIEVFGGEYLRRPTREDLERILE